MAVIPSHCSYFCPHTGYMNPGGPPPVQGFGMQAGTEIDPGSLGQMDSGGASQTYANSDGYGQAGFEDEPPLLQELGIDFELIKQKVCNYRVILIRYSSIFLLFWLPKIPNLAFLLANFNCGKGHHQSKYIASSLCNHSLLCIRRHTDAKF